MFTNAEPPNLWLNTGATLANEGQGEALDNKDDCLAYHDSDRTADLAAEEWKLRTINKRLNSFL